MGFFANSTKGIGILILFISFSKLKSLLTLSVSLAETYESFLSDLFVWTALSPMVLVEDVTLFTGLVPCAWVSTFFTSDSCVLTTLVLLLVNKVSSEGGS
jgi:hypothetical protein